MYIVLHLCLSPLFFYYLMLTVKNAKDAKFSRIRPCVPSVLWAKILFAGAGLLYPVSNPSCYNRHHAPAKSPACGRDLEFGKDVGDMIAHGFFTEDEQVGNLAIGAMLADLAENFALAFGQFGEGIGRRDYSSAQSRWMGTKVGKNVPSSKGSNRLEADKREKKRNNGLAPLFRKQSSMQHGDGIVSNGFSHGVTGWHGDPREEPTCHNHGHHV